MSYFVLPERQYEVIMLASQGLKGKEIAEKMYLSEKTVQRHLDIAYKKLGIKGKKSLPYWLKKRKVKVKI